MKAFLVGLALATFLAAPSAYAQHMNAKDAPCQDVVVTSDLSGCLDAAYRGSDSKLNQLYASVRKVLDQDEQKALVRAERLWVQYRDATCDAEYGLYGGGTAGAPAYSACLEAETRGRIKDLHDAYDWRLEK